MSRDFVGEMRADSTRPPNKPQKPTPPKPPPRPAPAKADDAQLLDDIDSSLIGLLAVAYFGPCEQGTAVAVEQACAAEVLLFRLRMARRAVADLRAVFESPARRDHVEAGKGLFAIATDGGPVQPRDFRLPRDIRGTDRPPPTLPTPPPPKPVRRRPGLADLPALMLPALLFNAAVVYTAWASWWT
jgi:hypothetical protein